MKKLLLILFLLPVSVSAYSARNLIAMDMDTKRILYGEKIHDEHLIASITKIMTAVVALELGNLDDDVTASKTILKSFGSSIYMEVGETLKLKDLLYGLMLRSGNDAALLISEHVGGSVNDFVKLMNNKAKELGMKDTTFYNPHGLEVDGKGNLSSAYDMALLTSYAMENKTYRQIVGTKNYVTKSDKKSYSWKNKNKLLTTYKYTTGGKTGYTDKARRTLVSTASNDNRNIVIVSLNDPDDWHDHTSLYETIFKEYQNQKILDQGPFKVANETYYQNDELYLKNDEYVLLKKGEEKDINLNIQLDKLPRYQDQEKVGTITINLKDTPLKTVDIYVHKAKSKKQANFWQKIMGWFKHD